MNHQNRYDFEQAPDPVNEAEITEEITVDLCIIGAGQAGTLAALTAGKMGASAVVLQKLKNVFCYGRVANLVNTKFQIEEYGERFNTYEFTSNMLRASNGRGCHGVIKRFYDESGECGDFINAICEEFGLHDRYVIYNDYKTVEVGWSDTTHYHRQNTFIRAMQPIIEELGVQFRFETPGYYLEQDETGRVCGVIAKKLAEGEHSYLRVRVNKGVILCTGDIGGNQEMLERYSTWAAGVESCYAKGVNTGDGHQMALWAGGLMQKGEFSNMIHLDPTVLPEGNAPLSNYPFLAVNLNGERFMNEEIVYQYKVNAALNQPEQTYYQIGGKNMASFVKSQRDIRNYSWDTAVKNGAIQEGATIEELAEKIGLPAETLRETICRYQDAMDKGVDEEFGKAKENFANTEVAEGPYYSIKRRASLLTVDGGLVTNNDLQVLDKHHKPIEGLYVAGNTVGRFYGSDYPYAGFGNLESGHSSGRAMTFGRVAAKAALGA